MSGNRIPGTTDPIVSPAALLRAIAATNRNVERLVEDAEHLHSCGRFPSAYAMAVLAQEEAAKVYLLNLILTGDVPWNEGVKRALRDHPCKQLLAMVLDYMDTKGDEIVARPLHEPLSNEDMSIPDRILSALELFRYHKVEAFIDGYPPFWDEDPKYDAAALRIAEGKLDDLKQNAIYVRIGKDGDLASEPRHAVSAELAERELERANRLMWAVRGLEEGKIGLWNYDEVRKVFYMLFTDPKTLRQQGLLS